MTIWLLFFVSYYSSEQDSWFYFNSVVSFIDNKDDDDSMQVIEELEKIDDDCDKHGIQFVKIDDRSAAKEYGIKSVRQIKWSFIYTSINLSFYS